MRFVIRLAAAGALVATSLACTSKHNSSAPSVTSAQGLTYLDAQAQVTPGAMEPLENLQWGLFNTGQTVDADTTDLSYTTIQGVPGTDIGIAKTKTTYQSRMQKDVIVAVIDTGVDVTHSELQGRILVNKAECDSVGHVPFQPQDDKDHNGFKGDCMGWNFSGNGDENRVDDDDGHGTHVAAAIAALDNGQGISGVATRVKILPIKVTSKDDTANLATYNSSNGLRSRLVKAFQYAILMKADVINLSMGWPTSADTPELHQLLAQAQQKGIVVVTAAGNSTSTRPVFPCAYDGVICVGAMNPDGSIAAFSNFGGQVDLMAPGLHILSAIPSVIDSQAYSIRGYDYKSGTSQAAPFVSGAFAVLKSIYPNATSDELKARLFLSARDRQTTSTSIAGLIQVDKAIEATAQSAVFPEFKGDDMIAVDPATRQFTAPMKLKNYWSASGSVRVDVTSSSHIRMAQSSFTVSPLATGREQLINLNGTLDALSSDQAVAFDVRVTDGARSSVYHFNRTLMIPALKAGATRIDVDLSQWNNPSPAATLAMITVKDLFANDEPTEYFSTITQGQGASQTQQLAIFRRQGNQLKPITMAWPKDEQLLNVVKVDANYDGQPDYVVYSSSAGADGGGLFKLWYLDSQLKPIFDFVSMPYEIDSGNQQPILINWQDMAWMSYNYGGKAIAIPTFEAQGSVVKLDHTTDPFEDNDDDVVKNRLYYVVPNASRKVFEVHNFDKWTEVKALQKQLGLHYPQSLAIKNVYGQSLADLHAAKMSVLIEVTGGQSSYFDLALTGGMTQGAITPLSGTTNMQGFQKIRQPGVEAASGLFLARTQSESIVEFALLRGAQAPEFFSYTHAPAKTGDTVVGALSALQAADGSVELMVETKTQIAVVARSSRGQQRVSMTPANRVTFLPGQTLSALYAPVKVGGLLGLYTDASGTYQRHLFALTPTAAGYVNPVANSLQIPATCSSLNPIVTSAASYFAFSCQNGSALSVYQVPMK